MEVTTKTVSELIESGESPLKLSVIPNHMGINLCSVEALTWVRQDDGQLVSLAIHFVPAHKEEEQLKVAVQDMLIELDITPKDFQRRVSTVMTVSDKEPVAKLSVKVCQKLIDAGVLEGTQAPGA